MFIVYVYGFENIELQDFEKYKTHSLDFVNNYKFLTRVGFPLVAIFFQSKKEKKNKGDVIVLCTTVWQGRTLRAG